MDQQSKDVKDFFHSYAAEFDAIYHKQKKRSAFNQWIDRRFRKTMYERFVLTLEHTQKPQIQSIIDVGCGSGRYVLEFLEQGKEVLGIDMAEGMLKIAKELAIEQYPNGHYDFMTADYLSADTKGKKYDAACLMGFFDYIEKPATIFSKLEQEVSKEIYASFPMDGGVLAWQRKWRYKKRNCPLYLYERADVVKIMDEVGWKNNYTLETLDRDLFLRVVF